MPVPHSPSIRARERERQKGAIYLKAKKNRTEVNEVKKSHGFSKDILRMEKKTYLRKTLVRCL